MRKRLKTNHGFSLIELLIVIGIMGVLALLAFNMFSGVFVNSKKRADDQLANNIEKAIISYMAISGDNKLEHMTYGTVTVPVAMDKQNSSELIYALQNKVTWVNGTEKSDLGVFLTPRAGQTPAYSNFEPQWNTKVGGSYVGYKIDVYPKSTMCRVVPVTVTTDTKITVH